MVNNNLFRRDLFHRLNVVTIEIPPLKERPEDIILLTNHFVEEFDKQFEKNIKKVDKDYQGYELKNRLISYLLESAFLSGKHMELKNLFELSDDTISAPCVLETIFNSSIYTEKYKFELIQHLAENKKSEKIFSKAFSDTLNVKDQLKRILII